MISNQHRKSRRLGVWTWVCVLVLPAATAASLSAGAEEPLPPPGTIVGHITDTRYYLRQVEKLRQQQPRYAASPEWRSRYLEVLGWWTSCLGNDREALECFDQIDGRPTAQAVTTSPLDGYQALDARAEILRLAEQHQVIMLNEAHHVPQHRAFTLSLLEGLYRRGFRYFTAETLTTHDPELAARGYPIIATGGYYTREPLHGELVRTALRLGYTVVPYEDEQAVVPYGNRDPLKAINDREQIQATNLYERILKRDPKARIVVHAGYGHISEKSTPVNFEGKPGEIVTMAVRFKALTNIDPLTIDQTARTEHSTPEYERPLYRHAADSGRIGKKATLFKNKAGEFYLPEGAQGVYDLMVFHPRSRYVDGRPTWRTLNGTRKPHRLPPDLRPPSGTSYLAQAFYGNERIDEAVPLDQVEIRSGEAAPALMLPRGRDVVIRVIDATGATVRQYRFPPRNTE